MYKIYDNYYGYCDFQSDIMHGYDTAMAGAYDKAGMWPLEDMKKGLAILDEELDEVRGAYLALEDAYTDYFFDAPSSKERFAKNPRFACQTLEGHAMSTILELLQVIAVCRKYVDVFEEETAAKRGEAEESEAE